MERDGLSKEAKARIKKNIDREIKRREAIFERLSDEDKKRVQICSKAILEEENSSKFLKLIRRMFKAH